MPCECSVRAAHACSAQCAVAVRSAQWQCAVRSAHCRACTVCAACTACTACTACVCACGHGQCMCVDAHRIDRSVEDHPAPLDRLVLRALPVDDRQDAIRPLMAHRVELSVQPARRHRLGVEARVAHLDIALLLGLGEQRERGGEGAVVSGLAREWESDDHEAVAHEEHLVDLEHLGDEVSLLLQPLLFEDRLHGAPEQVVVGGRQVDAREEVGGDAVEERHVGREELGQVDVGDGAQHQDGLVLVGELLLEPSVATVSEWSARRRGECVVSVAWSMVGVAKVCVASGGCGVDRSNVGV